jgi:hypothetical protein
MNPVSLGMNPASFGVNPAPSGMNPVSNVAILKRDSADQAHKKQKERSQG